MYSLSASAPASAACSGMNWARGVPLVREEEHPGVELADARVEAVGEVGAPAQDVDAAGLLVGQAHMGVGRREVADSVEEEP